MYEWKALYLTNVVSLDMENLVISFNDDDGYLYEVDLERCRDANEVFDWICHIREKRWMTPEIMHDFLECLDHACRQVFGHGMRNVLCRTKTPVVWGKNK